MNLLLPTPGLVSQGPPPMPRLPAREGSEFGSHAISARPGIAFALQLPNLMRVLAIAALFGVAHQDHALAETGGLTDPVEFQGVVKAARAADISPRFDGLVQAIHFTPGELVEEGDLLVQIMTLEQDYLLRMDKAKLARATAQLDLATAELERAETLNARDVVTEAPLKEAIARRDVAAADVSLAQTQIDMREVIIREFSLYAPFDGIISASFVNEGVYITKNARAEGRLATVTQLDPIHVVTEVPYEVYSMRHALLGSEQAMTERLVAFLILPDGTEYPHQGRVISGAFAFDEATQKIWSIVEFPNPKRLLRPGLRVTIKSMAHASEE